MARLHLGAGMADPLVLHGPAGGVSPLRAHGIGSKFHR
jgi:hypothetical protein